LKIAETPEHFVNSYGDLIFDLCQSVLQNPSRSQTAFRRILKKIQSQRRTLKGRFQKGYSTYERSWILRIVCDDLIQSYHKGLSSAAAAPSALQSDFETCFGHLVPEDQLLLLLKDKFGIPEDEISIAMNLPAGSLKIRRQQALRTLEEWMFT
jgi:DNA-directed RNA polymerase specialized sigma24 family protein